MGQVYSVEIEKASVARCAGIDTYHVEVFWKAQESPLKYEGKYLLEIIKDTEVVAREEAGGDARHAFMNACILDINSFYRLRLTVKESAAITDEVPLLLHTYENPVGTYDGIMLKLRWNKPASEIGGGKCTVKTVGCGIHTFEIRPYITGMEIPFDGRYTDGNEVLTVTLKPQIVPISSGPETVLEGIFCPEYEAGRTEGGDWQICYRRKSPEETSFSITLPGEIYRSEQGGEGDSKKPEQPIIQGPLELGVTSPYTLAIHTDAKLGREDYDRFVKRVFPLITTAAMYRILEIIARGARQSVEDMLYYHCGLSADKRCADLRPGLTLGVEQEMYLSSQLNGGDVAGFIGMHTAEYPVLLAHGDSMDYLEFNSFIALMDEETEPPRGNTEAKPVAAGIIDLCAVRTRHPFYRIQYPDAMYTSDAAPDEQAGNHIILLAAPGWEDVPLASNMFLPGREENRKVAEVTSYLLFRGRCALTLLLTVNVNGREKRIPAGTTLGKLLNQMGIYTFDAGQLQIYRRSPFGEETLLSVNGTAETIETLPLFHGDRIEG